MAVIGASERPESPGSVVIRNMLQAGYSGRIYPVNPRYESIHGIPATADIADLSESVDCAAICVNAAAVPVVLTHAAECGARSAVIFASGFSETGESGRMLQSGIRQIADTYEIAICGPKPHGERSRPTRAPWRERTR